MRLLLDTHILLWAAGEPERLPAGVRGRLNDPATELFYSAASLWEVSIKSALGREDFNVDPRVLRRGLMENGYRELTVTGAHAAAVDLLPALHKDPFDRMLVRADRLPARRVRAPTAVTEPRHAPAAHLLHNSRTPSSRLRRGFG